jgi:hypothetical protein
MTKKVLVLILIIFIFTGCSQIPALDNIVLPAPAAESVKPEPEPVPEPEPELAVALVTGPVIIPDVPVALASGIKVAENDKVIIDFSNTTDGYIMIRYLAANALKHKVRITGPSEIQYTYDLTPGDFEVFPLNDGDGGYEIGIYEQIEGTKYSLVLNAEISVVLSNPFVPFLRPNQFVNYCRDSDVVKKAAELVAGADSGIFMEKIAAVYHFVVDNIAYDYDLAATVESGYLPDVDEILASRKGICFDYAAIMTAMLRSQGIPTKLVIGYTLDVYHAWISVYSEETGWIDDIIFFDGKEWKLMDPTFDSTGGHSEEVMRYIGDGTNYTAKYQY